MRYLEAKPHIALREWVKCYWFFEKEYTSTDSGETILPDGCLDLIFSVGQGTSTLIGPLSQLILLPALGKTRTVGIRFYAYGIYPFLRQPLDELTNQTVAGELLFGTAASDLSQKLAECEPLLAFAHLEKFLLAHRQDAAGDVEVVKNTLHLLTQPDQSLRDAVGQMYLSPRVVERKFKQVTGFSPKKLIRVLRFNHLKNDLMLNPSQNLTQLAHRYHYFDQAHFNHDFRQFTGQTPSHFIQQVEMGRIRFYR